MPGADSALIHLFLLSSVMLFIISNG